MIFLFDLDGTLIYDGSDQIPLKNINILKKIQKSGHEPIIVTGRMFSATLRCIKNLNLNYAISYNGAMVSKFDNGWKIIKHSSLMEEEMKIVRSIIKKYRDKSLTFFLYDMDNLKYYGYAKHIEEYEKRSGIRGTFLKNIDNISFLSTKFLISTNPNNPELLNEVEKELSNHTENFSVTRSVKHYLEINRKGINKGYGVKFIRKIFPEQKIISFGDSYNDKTMFLESDISYSMPSSPDSIKKLVSKVLPFEREDSINHGVNNHLMKNNRSNGSN